MAKEIQKDALLNHLLESVGILKQIRKNNEQENEMIDTFIEKLLKEIEDKEDEAKEEEKKSGGSKEKKAEKKEDKDNSEKFKSTTGSRMLMQMLADLKIAELKTEKAKRMESSEKEKLEKSKTYKELYEEELGRSRKFVEDASTRSTTSTDKSAEELFLGPSLAEEIHGSLTGEVGSGGGTPEAKPEDAPIGKLWCTACNEYHDK